ncbi:hypothetical protein QR680_016084 [Steinernema hermaphroditum]|uniref:Metalloendopeptidase n=1 Tax=Steinernema hermaphroditum TaxID=289476 RepID=A0AA39HC57_9BILA|nr:hypothetical protein QR680_016084 [Steinernema hermaphroditum]
MRILLFVLAFSAQAFALQDGPSLRGRDLLKQVLPEFKDIDEVADLIADNKWKKEERIAQEQDAAYDEEMAKTIGEVKKLNPRPLPNSAQKSITEINSALGLDEVLVEGDILMTADEARRYFEVQERRSKRQAYQRWDFPKSLWSNGVYYTYDPAMNQQGIDAVEDAIAFWQKHTCVRFHRVQNGASVPVDPLLIFYPGWGCFSAMGRNHYAKEQKVSIGSGCEYVSVATHEIAHALGFMHEQSRWDRDNYLWIDLNNVIPNKTHNYDNYNKNENDNYGKQYDFSGIMHYEDNSFAINSSVPAMYARNSAYQMSIGGAQIPAYGDIYEMNMLYSCYAPAGKRLQYYVTEVGVDYNPDVLCTRVCYFGGLSIKGLEKTWIPQGMRFCCKDQFNRVMITASNILVVQPWNNFRYTDFSIMYKIDGTAQPPTTKKTTTTTTTKSTLKPTTTTRPVTTSEPGQVFGYNDYIFSTFKKTFQDAEDFCKSYNAHLISLHDKATEDDIEALFSRIGRNKNQAYWIGLHKPQGINSRFSWVDGSYLNYTNWMNGLPGATPSEECGAHQYSQWVGVSCQSKNPFVCERY